MSIVPPAEAAPPAAPLPATPPAPRLAGRVVLVTGAGSGLGRALALAAARDGATLLLCGRRQRPLEATYDAIVAAGGPRPALLPFDLENALGADYDRLAEAVGAEFGRLDALVHCAALLGTRAPIALYDVPTWCRVLQVNLTGAFALTQALLDLLGRGVAPTVVFTTCTQGRRGSAYWGAYAAAKAGLERFAEVLADEHEGRLAVHCVDPGPMHTALRALVYPAAGGTAAPSPEGAVPAFLALLGPAR